MGLAGSRDESAKIYFPSIIHSIFFKISASGVFISPHTFAPYARLRKKYVTKSRTIMTKNTILKIIIILNGCALLKAGQFYLSNCFAI